MKIILPFLFFLISIANADTPPSPSILSLKGGSADGAITAHAGSISSISPGASGNVLTSNGTVWTSATPPPGGVSSVNGQTGVVTVTANQLLPVQTGNSGKFLTTDGSNTSWSTVVSGVTSVNGFSGSVVLTTDNVAEGTTNKYFSGKTTTDLAEGLNLYYTQGRFDSAFSAKSTTSLPEGSNLYYTQARFDSALSAKTTSNLAEGSNLYYLDSRARGSVSASAPLAYNSGTGLLSIPAATSVANGYLTSTDWSTFNGKQNSLTIGNLTDAGTDGISVTGGTGSVIGSGTSFSQHVSDSTHNGYLSSSDWSAFNGKQAALTPGSISSSTSGVTVGNGSSSTVGPNVTVDVQTASGSQPGLLSSADWTNFNSKQNALSLPLSIAHGGTGQTTANAALNAILPDQSTASTKFLQSDGINTLWASVSGGTPPDGSQTSTSVVTSATTTFVTALTTTVTLTTSAKILAVASAELKATSSACVANHRVTINGVAGQVQKVSLLNTTDSYSAANVAISGTLSPGTYTVTFDIARASGTGTVNFFQGSITSEGLQGATSNGITQLTGALQAGPGSGAQALTGTLPIANGGTNQTSAAVNGAVVYSTASAYGYTAAGSSGQLLRSAGAASPTWTTETFPASTTINQILYSSAANVVSGLATANTGALVTSSTGVPSITSGATANRLLRTNGTTVSFAQANLTSDVTGTLPAANGGTGVTAFASQRIPFGTGTSLTTDASFIYDTTNQRLSVGGSGTATGNFIVASGSKTALQAFNSSAGNAFQATNVSAYSAALISRQNNATTGASIGFEFGRGTPASPTGALNGDQIGVIVATPDAASGSAFGYSGAISFVATEDATTTATGGDIVLATTPNTTVLPVERLRITQAGDLKVTGPAHLIFSQTTAPTAAVQANAGTGATCSLSADSTDTMGQVTITTGTIGISTGSYCKVTLNRAHPTNPPRCQVSQAGTTLSTSVGIPSTTSDFDLSFGVAGGISATYLLNYFCPGSP